MKKRVFVASPKRKVMAADEFGAEEEEGFDEISEDISDVADAMENIQDMVEEDDDPVDTILDTENNIDDHYIAECTHCHEIFISAVIESETPMASVFGECPMCHEEADQELKWVIRSVDDLDDEEALEV